jgi:wyosine [tRNA(Phe)-imidazoG37] synthetase (radical SAM superfamily)
VDLLVEKICSFNCVYCEVRKSSRLYRERGEYVPLADVLAELRDFMGNHPSPDYVTLSGSGEPTLHSGIGEFIRTVKREFPDVRVAVITNSSMLPLPEVRAELLAADVVLPSLDGVTEDAFIRIDRPHPAFHLRDIEKGIADFCREFHAAGENKQVWLEVFIVEGINDGDEHTDVLREVCRNLGVDRIQLNSLDRPGVEDWVKPAPMAVLEHIRERLSLPNTEIIRRSRSRSDIRSYRTDVENLILEFASRRPCTLEDLQEVTGLSREEVSRYLDVLEKEKIVTPEIGGEAGKPAIFYRKNQETETNETRK